MEELKVLELYSGIGGMHYGLEMSGINAKVVGAVDINPQANTVYKHNFKETKLLNKTIEGIKLDDFNKLNFDMILMSPPCQPFTRQGNQNGAVDPRAKSFLSLIDMMPKLAKKPKFILMENVKGFDEDQAREKFIDMLKSLNYNFQEFLLSPIQFGIPNSRLRYFLIAKLDEPFSFETKPDICKSLPEEESLKWIENLNKELVFDLEKVSNQLDQTPHSKETNLFRDVQPYQLNESHLNCSQSESKHLLAERVRELNEFVLDKKGTNENLFVTDKQFTSMNHADFVTVKATRTCCFTKNYGRFMDGTGSILRTSEDSNNNLRINKKSLRFLTPREVANLHCFPNNFEYPDEITTIQGWRLIGNSLNVFIVAILIKLMTK